MFCSKITSKSRIKGKNKTAHRELLFFGAVNENRTHTGHPIRPSNVRVYQFRHHCSDK